MVTLCGAVAQVGAVLVLLRGGGYGGLGYWLVGCGVVWWVAGTLDAVLVPRAARAVDHAARRTVLGVIAGAAEDGRLDAGDRELGDAVHAAAGVAVRWEPKPGTSVGPGARLVRDVVVVGGVCGALGAAYAPAGWACAGVAVLGGGVRVRQYAFDVAMRARQPAFNVVMRARRHVRDVVMGARRSVSDDDAVQVQHHARTAPVQARQPAHTDPEFGRAQWLALARRARWRPLVARVSALGLALTAFLVAGSRPGLEAGAVLGAVLLYRAAAGPGDLTAVWHGVTALRRVRALVVTAAGAPAGTPTPRTPRTPREPGVPRESGVPREPGAPGELRDPGAPRNPGEHLTVRPLPGGGLRVRLVQPGFPVREVRMAPGASVCLVTYRAATDVLRRLMTSATGPVLMVPPDPLRLGFAGLVDNVTLGTRPLPPDLAPLADALPHAFLSAEYTDGADLDDATWSTVTAARLTAHLPDTPVLICLAVPPTPALAAALDHARARGACVLRLTPANPEPT